MVGQILGTPGNLPDVYRQIEIKTHLLPRLLGVAQEERKDKDGNTRKKGLFHQAFRQNLAFGNILETLKKTRKSSLLRSMKILC